MRQQLWDGHLDGAGFRHRNGTVQHIFWDFHPDRPVWCGECCPPGVFERIRDRRCGVHQGLSFGDVTSRGLLVVEFMQYALAASTQTG